MVQRRRLNIPLSVLLALGVACGLGGVGGLVIGAEEPDPAGPPAAALGALVTGGGAAREGCTEPAVPLPRLRQHAGCQDPATPAHPRLPHRR